MPKGWGSEPARHSLAARGRRTRPRKSARPKPRFNVDYGASVFYYKPDAQYFTFMSPDEFLRLAARRLATKPSGEKVEVWYRDSIEKLRKRIRDGRPIDPLFLDVEIYPDKDVVPPGWGAVLDHEGRHRAIAAKEEGVDKVPVVMYARRKGYYYDASAPESREILENWRARIMPQTEYRDKEIRQAKLNALKAGDLKAYDFMDKMGGVL